MALDFTALEAELTRDNDVNSSAATLIEKLADEIEAAGGDKAKLDELVAKLRAQSDALAAAVAANTPGQGGGSGGGTSAPKRR
jgi:hypothetical protein